MSSDFKTASMVIAGIVIFAIILLLGDYLGYKFGRMKIASYTLFTVLGLVIIYAIYAVVRSFLNV